MTISEFGNAIPSGCQLGNPLGNGSVFGSVFELADMRLDSDQAIQRVIRFLQIEEPATPWCKPLLERLTRLTKAGIPNVSVPLEAGIRGDLIYLITDRYDDRLWEKLPENQGLDVAEANDVFRQVIHGLAELHSRGIAHGDVQTKNVYLNRADNSQITAWLVDTAIGPLTCWSGGKLRDPDANRYYPPEWNGKTKEPSASADMYALGLTACELFLGPRQGASNATGVGDSKRVAVKKELKRAGVPRSTRDLIDALLNEDPHQRPQDANEALSLWANRERAANRRMPVMITAAAALALLLIVGSTARSTAGKLAESERQLAEANERHDELQRDYDDLLKQSTHETEAARKTIAAQAEEIRHLQKRPAVASTIVVESTETVSDSVKTSWLSFLKSCRAETTNATLLNLIQSAERVEPSCVAYYRELRGLYNQAALPVWLVNDDELSKAMENYLFAPWDKATKTAVESRYSDLQEAKEIWKHWASPNSGLTWENIESQTEASSKLEPRIRAVLAQWLNEIASFRSKGWTIRLKQAKCEAGYKRDRIVTVYSGERPSVAWKHAWDSETSHDYTASESSKDIQFEWHPDELFGLKLEQHGYLANTNLIDTNSYWTRPMRGPLAVWHANLIGRTESNIASLTFEILNCPGPPPEACATTAK